MQLRSAAACFEPWNRAPASSGRRAVPCADWLRRRRFEIAALEVFEAGKCWDDADADVAEAIDFLEYYGGKDSASPRGQCPVPPGESTGSAITVVA